MNRPIPTSTTLATRFVMSALYGPVAAMLMAISALGIWCTARLRGYREEHRARESEREAASPAVADAPGAGGGHAHTGA